MPISSVGRVTETGAAGSLPCPACGTVLAAQSKLCCKCGATLEDAQAKTGRPTAAKARLIAAAFAVIVFIVLPLTIALLVPNMLHPGGVHRVNKGHADIQSFKTARRGHDYVYHYPGVHDSSEPEIICLGADGQPGGDGINADIVSWEKQ